MDASLFIWSTATFIETRVRDEIDYAEMEKSVGFSYRHIRETFKENTGITLSRYILLRRLANSAFDIAHSNKSLTEIASDYMFESYDVFTRAFKRHMNILPSHLRKHPCSVKVGRRRILIGMYGPTLLKQGEMDTTNQLSVGTAGWKQNLSEVDYPMNNNVRTKDSCVLYGVPKVAYSFEECTPFCAAMKACLNYMGQQIDYAYVMAITGAAFRLRWNVESWDGGNVDIMNIYEDRYEAFHRAFTAAGRSYCLLKREDSSKEGFIRLIKEELEEGRPVIAFGIIGPPEACLITGYRDNGNQLLGWNCFQDNQEFGKNVSRDDSGYFITDGWWENESTVALIAVGEQQEALASHKETLTNALQILNKEKVVFYDGENNHKVEYAGGQLAYDYWARRVGDDKEFPNGAILPLLYERLVCQNDAMVMLAEGRFYAVTYLEWVGKEVTQVEKECKQAAEYLRRAAELGPKMSEVIGGYTQDEERVRYFAKPEVRRELVTLINKAKGFEAEAAKVIAEIIEML
jgi:AraC-like DNA-binding protein